jgi:DNA-binding MarR family transcriptional regulator
VQQARLSPAGPARNPLRCVRLPDGIRQPLTPGATLTIRAVRMVDPKSARPLQLVARALARLSRERARTEEVTPQQAEALQVIAERGCVSTSSLAAVLGIDPSTASRNLAGLERAGLVSRRRDNDDGRQAEIRLTPLGKRTEDAVSSEWSFAYSSLLDRISRPERQRVAEALELLARLLDECGSRGGSD